MNCAVVDCVRPVIARGWCTKHYQRWQAHGDPEITLMPALGASIEERITRDTRRRGECREWIGDRRGRGYGRITVSGRSLAVHRLVWEMRYGPIPDRMFVCHHCDNPPCCEISHLFLGAPADNAHDMISKGRRHVLAGATHPLSRLSDSDVMEIRRQAAIGVSYGSLGVQYHVSRSTIWRAVNRLTQHLTKGT